MKFSQLRSRIQVFCLCWVLKFSWEKCDVAIVILKSLLVIGVPSVSYHLLILYFQRYLIRLLISLIFLLSRYKVVMQFLAGSSAGLH